MKTIIVATDFSVEAENAVEYAGAAARETESKLVLFHLYKIPVHTLNSRVGPRSFDELYNASKKRLATRVEEIEDKYQIQVEAAWHKEDFYEELKYNLTTHNASLLVLGMPKKSFEQDLMGNTTTGVIHRLQFPILAVPEGAKFDGIHTILFAADALKEIQKESQESIKEIADAFGAHKVEILHVSDKVEEIKKKGTKEATEKLFNEGENDTQYFYKNVESKAVVEEIQKEITNVKADLLIMIPNQYGFWASLVHRSKTRMMASGLEIPLLSLAAKEI